jgi:hypothetical protein
MMRLVAPAAAAVCLTASIALAAPPPAAKATAKPTVKPTGLAAGTAKGTLTVNGKAAVLKYAYAGLEPNPFDDKQDDIVIVLSDQPIPDEVLGQKELSSAPHLAHLKNYLKFEFREGKDAGMGAFLGTWMVGNRVVGHEVLGDKSLQSSPDFDSQVAPVAVGKDRVEATISTKGVTEMLSDKVDYKIAFNTAVRPRPVDPTVTATNGKPLPAGGGDPGKAYLALNKAMLAGDLATLKKLAPAGELPPDEQLKQMLPMMKEMAAKNVKIVSGFVNGDNATLNLVGDSMGQKGQTGTVQMSQKGGAWRVVKESWK